VCGLRGAWRGCDSGGGPCCSAGRRRTWMMSHAAVASRPDVGSSCRAGMEQEDAAAQSLGPVQGRCRVRVQLESSPANPSGC
jgi:hypothetical protein